MRLVRRLQFSPGLRVKRKASEELVFRLFRAVVTILFSHIRVGTVETTMNTGTWVVVGVVVLVIVGIGVWMAASRTDDMEEAVIERLASPVAIPVEDSMTPAPPAEFQQIKGAHFVSSEPAHDAQLTTGPTKVTVNFNFTLANGSQVTVEREGVDVTTGPTTIAADKLSLSVPVNASQAGGYVVSYTGCWPDGSCHTGAFGFSVK